MKIIIDKIKNYTFFKWRSFDAEIKTDQKVEDTKKDDWNYLLQLMSL